MSETPGEDEIVTLPPDPVEVTHISITPVLFVTYPNLIAPHPTIVRLARKKGLRLDGVIFQVISAQTKELYFEFIQKFGHGTLQFLVDYSGKPLLKVERTDAFTSTIIGGNERVIGQVRYYRANKPYLKRYVINFTDYNLGDQVLTTEYEEGTKNVEFRLKNGTQTGSPWLGKMCKSGMFDDYQLEIRPGVDIGFLAVLGCLRAQTIRKSALLTPQETSVCPLSSLNISQTTVIYNIRRNTGQLCGNDNPVIFTPHGDDTQVPCFIVETVNSRQQMVSTLTTDGVQVPVAVIKVPFSRFEAACCTPLTFIIDAVAEDSDAQRLSRKVTLCFNTMTASWRESGDIGREIKVVRKVEWEASVEFHLSGVNDVAIGQMSKATPKEKGWQCDKDHWGQLEITSGIDLTLMVALSSVCVIRMFPK